MDQYGTHPLSKAMAVGSLTSSRTHMDVILLRRLRRLGSGSQGSGAGVSRMLAFGLQFYHVIAASGACSGSF